MAQPERSTINYNNVPFHSRTRPSSPDEARIVPVIFQLTRHTYSTINHNNRLKHVMLQLVPIKHCLLQIFINCLTN